MDKLATIFLTFLLTGLVGNWLVHKWQARNWLTQQKFLGREKEYAALKELIDEVTRLLAARIYLAQRLTFAIRAASGEAPGSPVSDHDAIVKEWNERLPSFYARLPLLVRDGIGMELETSFHVPLVAITLRIESVKKRKAQNQLVPDSEFAEISHALNRLKGKAVKFNKSLIRFADTLQGEIYVGKRLAFNRANLNQLSTSELIKALFISDVKAHSIVRTPLDS